MIETESFIDDTLGIEVLLIILEEGDDIQHFENDGITKSLLKVRRKIDG